jgi:hypothetical protein
MRHPNVLLLATILSGVAVAGWQVLSPAQQPPSPTAKGEAPSTPGRLEFDVVESYDAKYLGDTPGHLGRGSALGQSRLQVALFDAVRRGDEIVGRITYLKWNRPNGSLDVEFDPVDHARVFVGDRVWVSLDGSPTGKAAAKDRAP